MEKEIQKLDNEKIEKVTGGAKGKVEILKPKPIHVAYGTPEITVEPKIIKKKETEKNGIHHLMYGLPEPETIISFDEASKE